MTFLAPAALMEMFTYRRPAGSRTEADFIKRFLAPLGVKPDEAGNLHKRIGTTPVLWSCHTDTVNRGGGRQAVTIKKGKIALASGSKSNCLGADDTAGVWLMSEMIKAEVPGLYIFHYGEEVGGIGSQYVASETPHVLDGIKMAIALDRRGYNSVITHQFGRCCSDTFAEALGDAIGLGMQPDDTGLFTDTANYTDLVPECTNLSVGYDGSHGPKETQDVAFLLQLRDRLLKLDVCSLPIVRDVRWDDDPNRPIGARRMSASYRYGGDHATMVRIVKENPEMIVDMLEDYGLGIDELLQAVYDEHGYIPTH